LLDTQWLVPLAEVVTLDCLHHARPTLRLDFPVGCIEQPQGVGISLSNGVPRGDEYGLIGWHVIEFVDEESL
jgi:hypothetical protein